MPVDPLTKSKSLKSGSRAGNPNGEWGLKKPDPLADDGGMVMPKGLTAIEKRKWNELLVQMQDTPLRALDVHQFCTLVDALCQIDKLRKKLRKKDPLPEDHRHYKQYWEFIHKVSPLYGLNPIDRRRMSVEPAKADAGDTLMSRMGGKVA